jgi:excisionase family DNA binding protein
MCGASRVLDVRDSLLGWVNDEVPAGGFSGRKISTRDGGKFSGNGHRRRLHRRNTHVKSRSLRASFPITVLGVLSRFDLITNRVSMSTNFSDGSADEWISQAEAARIRGVSRQAVARLIKRQRVPTLRIGGRLLVKRTDIEQFKPEKAGRPPK